MGEVKKLNRNAFSEKLIHRYLLERYYFSNINIRNSLLPKKFHLERINLIVPEKNGDIGYRADLTLYFKNFENPVPIEVKWSANEFNKPNQIKFIKENNGFVVSFSPKPTNAVDSVDYVQIDYNDFYSWITNNITKLTRESVGSKINDSSLNNGKQDWVVFLRGTAINNFFKMVKEFPSNPFWAFEQNKKALFNIFDIEKGDTCIFILGKANEGMGMSNKPESDLIAKGWFVTTVKEPYYMVLEGNRGTFFESGNIPVYSRRWPHFIDFEIKESMVYSDFVKIGKRGSFSKALTDSYNNGHGTPTPLSRKQAESLTDLLRYK